MMIVGVKLIHFKHCRDIFQWIHSPACLLFPVRSAVTIYDETIGQDIWDSLYLNKYADVQYRVYVRWRVNGL